MPLEDPHAGLSERELKKAMIAHAAIAVFAESGVSRTRMVDVAQAAGVGKGTIYEYFRSKDELFEFAVNHFFQDIYLELATALSKTKDPQEQLELLVRSTIEFFLKSGSECRIMFQIWAQGVREGESLFDLGQMYTDYRAMIGGILTEGEKQGVYRKAHPSLVASIIISVLDGLILQWILDEDAFDLKDAEYELIELLKRGLAPE